VGTYVFLEYQFKYFDVVGIPYATPRIGAFEINTPVRWYALLLPLVILVYLGLKASLKSREGRAMLAMRDHELAATAMGVDVRILRLKAFGLSSAIASVAGALFAYYLSNVTSEAFNINFAIQFIAMIIIGGMGSLPGSLVGAAIWLLLPSIIAGLSPDSSYENAFLSKLLVENRAQLVQLIFSLLVIVFLIFAPGGVAGLSTSLKTAGRHGGTHHEHCSGYSTPERGLQPQGLGLGRRELASASRRYRCTYWVPTALANPL
jgi:branched-chain amino acid transport system permease protein